MAETLNETDELDRLFDAITPRDGSMPDLGDIQIAAERAYPVVRAERARSQGLEEAGNRLALMLAASFHHNGYGTPEHEERCREAMRQWAALSTAPGAVGEATEEN